VSLVGTIVACAVEMRADLIVMQTDGRDSALDSIIGSTTERVIHEAPCPVLAIPRSSLDDVNRERLFGR
jgi:nucleotide-binding universal stress UspA family protein